MTKRKHTRRAIDAMPQEHRQTIIDARAAIYVDALVLCAKHPDEAAALFKTVDEVDRRIGRDWLQAFDILLDAFYVADWTPEEELGRRMDAVCDYLNEAHTMEILDA